MEDLQRVDWNRCAIQCFHPQQVRAIGGGGIVNFIRREARAGKVLLKIHKPENAPTFDDLDLDR